MRWKTAGGSPGRHSHCGRSRVMLPDFSSATSVERKTRGLIREQQPLRGLLTPCSKASPRECSPDPDRSWWVRSSCERRRQNDDTERPRPRRTPTERYLQAAMLLRARRHDPRAQSIRAVLRPHDELLSAPTSSRRRRTRFWFIFYTAVLLAIAGVGVATHQWSVAVTTLAIALVFGLYSRRLWRKR